MNDAEIRATIAKAEEQQRKDPAAYEQHLALLAMLGYAYLFAISIGLIVLALLIIWGLYFFHYYVLIKFSFLLIITVWLIIKSMWVKFPKPDGLNIRREQAPKLFKLIEDIQASARGPHIDEVLVDDQFNACICQLPRLGIFGFHKNILVLGLPLMQAVSEQEFAAVLAHEMGHLSKKHGQVGCWIAHVYTSWIQIYVNLTRESALGNAPIKKFAEWFVPYFDAHSLALRRAHEHAADQIGADVAGAHTMSRALAAVAVKGDYLQEKFWPSVGKQVETSELPPKDIYAAMAVNLHERLDHATIEPLLEQNWRKHKPMDSHPSLSERVRALEPDKNWDVGTLSAELAQTADNSSSAAEALLGTATAADIQRQLDEKWHQAATEVWKVKHAQFLEKSKDFTRLEELLHRGELTEPQASELAAACVHVKDAADAIAYLQMLAERFPNQADLQFTLGMMLLTEKRGNEAVPQLEKAIALNPVYGRDACSYIAGFLEHHERDDEAAQYRKRSEEFEKQMSTAAAAAATLTMRDVYQEHQITVEAAARLAEQLHQLSYIKQAYLVSRVLPDILGKHQEVLVLKLDKAFVGHEEKTAATFNALIAIPECAGLYAISWENILQNLGTACKTFPSALIYNRETFEPGMVPIAPTPVAQTQQHLVYSIDPKPAEQPSFIKKHRGNLIAAGIVLVFISVGIGSGFKSTKESNYRVAEPEPRVPDESRNVHYANYQTYMQAVQRRIKNHWFPPRLDHSTKTVMLFKIANSGDVSDIRIKQTSGDNRMDYAARAAVKSAGPFSPLPERDRDSVDIEFTLDYNVHKP